MQDKMIRYPICLLIVILLLCGCREVKPKQTLSIEEKSIKIENLIDTTMNKIIDSLRDEPGWWKMMNDNPIDSLVIAVKFDKNDKNKDFFGSDTVVYFSFLDNKGYHKDDF